MRKKGALDRLCLLGGAAYNKTCSFCTRNKSLVSNEEKKPLISSNNNATSQVKLKDVIAPPTLAFQLKPKMVLLRVNMHCNGCARKVEKHISKLEGVSSYEVDLETKMVVVTGDIFPFEVLESVSKVKYAELWDNQSS